MKLYYTGTSPYARLARIVVLEKGLANRIEMLEAKTRTLDSPYYQVNPSGRVPFLVSWSIGISMAIEWTLKPAVESMPAG